MSPHEQNDDLGRLLNDAVSDIEPRSGIQAIRSRTSAKESAMTTTRSWIFGAFGAAVATAAVITGVVLAGNNNPSADQNGDPANPTSPSADVTNEPTDDPTEPTTSEPPAGGAAVPVYYVGETPQGPRLYREFHAGGANRLLDAANAAASGTPDDPDYRSAWPEGTTFESVSFDGVGKDGLIQVTLSDESVHDRPAGLSEREAQLAIEQVIYTLQGVVGARAPVQFRLGDNPIDQVLGVPTSEPLANGNITATLSLMNITSPAEGATLSGKVTATGVNSGFEAWVGWQILKGDEVVKEGFGTAEGWGDRLYPWEVEVDVTDLAPGSYTFKAMNDDPSGGAEGNGPHFDTKTITIE
jgi:hypothetical protein